MPSFGIIVEALIEINSKILKYDNFKQNVH